MPTDSEYHSDPAGAVVGIPFEEYRSLERMNPSTLVAGCKSMKSLKRAIDTGGKVATDKMRFGTQMHTLLLEPEEFEAINVVMPSFHLEAENVTTKGERTESKATNYYKNRVKEFAAENAGREIISREDYDKALCMIEAIHDDEAAAELLRNSQREVTLIGEIAGVPFKGRIDLLGDAISDVKSTANADKFAFGRVFANMRYAFKTSIYRELVRQAGGGIKDVYLIAIESDGDFDCCVYPIPDIVLDNAFEEVQRVIERYKECMESGKWPGVNGGKRHGELHIPNWAMPEEEALDWSAT